MSTRVHVPRRRRIFLGCEGESEQAYGSLLQTFAKENGCHIHLVITNLRPAGDALKLADRAVRLAQEERKNGRLTTKVIMIDDDWPSDQVERTRQVQVLLRKNGFIIILQKPNHEAFLLRHFPRYKYKKPPSNLSERTLKRLWPEYRKGLTGNELAKQLTLEHIFRASKTQPGLKSLLNSIGLATHQA